MTLYWPLNCKGLAFSEKVNAILHKMLNLGFRNFRPIFLKSNFLIGTFFLYLWLSVWVDIYIINIWRQRGKSVSRAFPKIKNLVVCAKFPLGSKFHFFKWRTYFTQFIDKFFKFEDMEISLIILGLKYGHRCVNFLFSIIFSAVKLKLGHNCSQFIYRFKIGAFESWS